jgi:hypothetical protein
MRRAAILVLFALLATTMIAQTPAGTSNHPATTPQTQGQQGTPTEQGEDTQRPTPGANANPAANQSQQASPSTMNPTGAQNSTLPSQATQAAVNDQVVAGTEIHATLDTPLSTKTSKPGDRFTGTITEPVRGSGGGTVIPAGTRVEGEVAEMEEAKALPALRDKPNLSLRFRDVVLPTGQTLPLTATLISVNSMNGKNAKRNEDEGQRQSGGRNRDVAGTPGIGAPSGNSMGAVFGSPLKGLAIGTLAGGGYVLSTKGKDVNLPAQTGMVIRLDQPVSSSGVSAQSPR